MSTAKTWFITGTSRGFGREWTIAALERGDRVAATARNTDSLDDLVAEVRRRAAPDRARRHRPGGRLRRGQAGARPLRPAGRRGQQRRLRALRHGRGAQRGRRPRPDGDQPVRRPLGDPGGAPATCASRAAATSSRCPRSAASPRSRSSGMYHASKWALEGFSQSLAQEVADFGIKVTLVEPGGFSTDWSGPSAKHSEQLAAYDEMRAKAQAVARLTQRRPRRPDRQRRRDPAGRRRRGAAAARVLRRGPARHRDRGLRVPPQDLERLAARGPHGAGELTGASSR